MGAQVYRLKNGKASFGQSLVSLQHGEAVSDKLSAFAPFPPQPRFALFG